MAYNNPSVQDFKDQFPRDFPYGTDIKTSVLDSDISAAFRQTNVNINQGLFADQSSYTLGYNYLAAHYLSLSFQTSSQGFNGQYNFLQNSKGVGGVNEAFAIPQRILDNPYFSMLTKTTYGARYFELILPKLTGQMFSVYGPARAL